MPGVHLSRRQALGVLGLGAMGLGAATGCGEGTNTGAADETGLRGVVRVGLVIPQAGVYTPLGVDMLNGWQLFLDGNDGLLGGYRVDTVIADEGEGPDVGVPAVSEAISAGQVDVLVGIVNSGTALGCAEAVNSAKKLLIVANAGAGAITSADTRSPYIWRTSFTNSQTASSLGAYLADQAIDGGVYLMAADYAAGREAAAGFRTAYERAGGVIVGETFTPFGTTENFEPFLAEIEDSEARATFVFYAGAEAVSYVQQYSAYGLKEAVPLFGSGFLTEGGVLPAQGEAALGVQTSLHYTSELENDANRAFRDAYAESYGGAVPTCYSVQTWDAALVLDRLLAEVDNLDGYTLSQAMGGIGDISDSPRGPWFFNGQSPEQSYYLRIVTASEGRLVNTPVDFLGTFAPSL